VPTVNPRPRGSEGQRDVNRKLRANTEQVRRQRVEQDAPPVLVQISDEENLSWPVGTAWLDTSGEA